MEEIEEIEAEDATEKMLQDAEGFIEQAMLEQKEAHEMYRLAVWKQRVYENLLTSLKNVQNFYHTKRSRTESNDVDIPTQKNQKKM